VDNESTKKTVLAAQDFKEKLLEANVIVEEEENIADELFGEQFPQAYIMRKANYKELFAIPRGRDYQSKMKK
jgi:hypothetical protein